MTAFKLPSASGGWQRFFSPPVFDSAEDTRWAGMLHAIVVTVFAGYGLALLVGVPFVFANKPLATVVIGSIILADVFAAACLRDPGRMRIGGAVLAFTLWVVPVAVLLLGASNNVVVFVAPVLVIAVLFGAAWGIAVTALSAAVSVFLIFAVEWRLDIPRLFPSPPLGQAFIFVLQLALAIVPVQLIVRRLGDALRRADTETGERLQAQASLQQSESRYRAVIGTMTEGMIVRDMQGKLLICNPAAERIIGLPASQMGHDTFPLEGWHTIREDGSPFAREDHPVMRTRRTGQPLSGVVMGFVRPHCEPKWISINSVLLHDEDRVTPQAVLTTFFDITSSKQAAAAVMQLNADLERRVQERTLQLEALNRDLDAFSTTVSHDLRAPVRHISGYLGLLQENLGAGVSAENRKYLEAAGAATVRMAQMIQDLLEFSRLGRAELRLRRVDLAILVSEAVQSLEPDTRGRDIRWLLHDLPAVQADPSLLRQVLVNLLSNAIKYTRPVAQAQIEVGVVAGSELPDAAGLEGQVVLFVRDNGVGFSMQHAPKLFGVFQRLHSASEFEGSGIGLANVGNIIRRHGGKAWIDGEEGKGATAYVSLPGPAPG